MKVFRKYGWVFKIVGAALLIGLAIYLQFDDGEKIVITFVGASMIVYSGIRLVPFVKTQGSDLIKTINIMEITIDIMIGIFLIVYILTINDTMGTIFGYLVGPYFIMRGAVHFYGVSTGKEKSDLPLYIFHILALILGSYITFYRGADGTPGFEAAILIYVILFFSVVVGGYLIYDGGKGYKVYRYEKALYQTDVTSDSATIQKELPVIEEPETEQDTIVS